jgi:hypothetical protein
MFLLLLLLLLLLLFYSFFHLISIEEKGACDASDNLFFNFQKT